MPCRKFFSILVALVAVISFQPAGSCSAAGEESKVQAATTVLKEIMNIPENAIPPGLLQRAQGIAIFPDLFKAGFLFGGRYGVGVVMVRHMDGNWSAPVFFSIVGGSFGLQLGAQVSDIILVFTSTRSLDYIASGKVTLGLDASIAAGPVGRHAEAATDQYLRAEILSYSRSKGLFGGVALEGAALQVEYGANADYYNSPGVLPMDIFRGRNVQLPASAMDLVGLLSYYARR